LRLEGILPDSIRGRRSSRRARKRRDFAALIDCPSLNTNRDLHLKRLFWRILFGAIEAKYENLLESGTGADAYTS
jgi:hypothetical protein